MRIAAPFPHQDPAVQPSAEFHLQAPYTPSPVAKNLLTLLRLAQDIDTALLGVVAPSRPGGAVSTARHLVRELVLGLDVVIRRVAS